MFTDDGRRRIAIGHLSILTSKDVTDRLGVRSPPVTDRLGVRSPPRHLVPPLEYSGVCISPVLIYEIDDCLLF
jgi:hypothetical protein